MKIAYLTADFGIPVFGTKGASIHVNSIANELSLLGHDVLVLTPNTGVIPPGKQNFHIEKISIGSDWESLSEILRKEDICKGNRLSKDIRNLVYNVILEKKGLEVLDSFRPDMIYERYSLFGTAGSNLARHYGIPLILEVNAPLVEEQQQQRGLSLPTAARETQRQSFMRADHVIVVSQWLKKYVAEHGVQEGRITVLPNGVDTAKFSPCHHPELKEKLGWQQSFIAGYVGSMKDWHGLPSVIKAISLVIKKKPNFRLLLVGEGPELPFLKSQINEMGLENYIHLTGLVPHVVFAPWISLMYLGVVTFDISFSDYFFPV
jgi:glycosyltransferase involved in cell wall biosynthesis